MKYIDAKLLKAEIERRRIHFNKEAEKYQAFNNGYSQNCYGARDALRDLENFLDTLEEETSYDTQNYTPSPSVDIEDVARVQFSSHAKVFDKKRKAVFDWEQFREVVGIFYGFGRKDSLYSLSEEPDKDLEEAAEEYVDTICPVEYPESFNDEQLRNAFKAGAEWQKEQMMKEAEIVVQMFGSPCDYELDLDFDVMDKIFDCENECGSEQTPARCWRKYFDYKRKEDGE